jgi:hypothetical protein
MKSIWIVITLLLATFGAQSASSANISCPANNVAPQLDAAYHACSNGYIDGSCQRFLQAFNVLTGRYDCQRSFDTAPVPAVWLSPEGALDDYVRLVFQIATKPQFKDKLYHGVQQEAHEFFTSKEFHGILDGALAEDYLPKSRALAKKLKGSKQ